MIDVRIAEHYAWEGEPDRAFEWLDRACAAHDTGLQYIKLEAALRPLHGDPRWAAFLGKMKLPADQLPSFAECRDTLAGRRRRQNVAATGRSSGLDVIHVTALMAPPPPAR